MKISEAKPLELSDKPLFDKYFKQYLPEISEFTFTNLFIWRQHYDYLFREWNDHLVIFSQNYFKRWKCSHLKQNSDAIYFLPPIGPEPEKIILELFKKFDNIEVHRVPSSIGTKIKEFKEFTALKLAIFDDRDNWDYVYERESLINLPGNKFRQKRRWLEKFFETYDYHFNLIITDELIKFAKQLQLKWCENNECQSQEDLMEEQRAIDEALDNFKELGMSGGIVGVEGNCIAYTLGEMLNENTVVIHIEKAHMEYEGAYQAINNLFLKECCIERANFVNREQDLGILGLRKAKEAYKPIKMIEKTIIFKEP